MLIDANQRIYLLETNNGPSLNLDEDSDRAVKFGVRYLGPVCQNRIPLPQRPFSGLGKGSGAHPLTRLSELRSCRRVEA